VTNCDRKIPIGRSGRKWQNNIEMYLEVVGWSGLFLRTRKNDRLLSTVGFHKMREISLLDAQLFSRWTPLHGIGLFGSIGWLVGWLAGQSAS
jgi:hypothetical protein